MKYLFYILLLVNIIGFLTMGLDKDLARKGKWRVSELVLFLYTLAGGGIGIYAGMYCFRHKTRKKIFTFGVPAIIILETVIAILLVLISKYH